MKHTSILVLAPILVIAIALAGSCGGGGPEAPDPAHQGRSLIVIAVDGLRADAIGCYGGAGASTPALDALAGESIRFDQAWSQAPTMLPSIASMMTGLYPTTHGLVEPGNRLAAEAPTLAETVAAQGLATAGFIQGAEGGDDFGLAKGFETYRTGPLPGQAALAWLDQHKGQDFFLLVAGFSAGRLEGAEEAPEGFKQRLASAIGAIAEGQPSHLEPADVETARSRYATHVTRMDSALAELIVSLRSRGVLDRSTLVVVGSSGLAIQEHGNLFGDGLWPETTRVPLFVRKPGGEAATVTKVVEVLDLMPTLAAAAGAPIPTGSQGADLSPLVAGTGTPPYVAFAETDNRNSSRAAIMDGMMLVTADGQSLLYNLSSDPAASQDVAGDFPERAEVLQSHIEAWSKMVAAASLDPERRSEDLDDETLDQLRSLGYIQ